MPASSYPQQNEGGQPQPAVFTLHFAAAPSQITIRNEPGPAPRNDQSP